MSTILSRNGKKWTVNEILKLQREYELLELDVNDIAVLHERTVEGILFRLVKEGYADDFASVRGYKKAVVEETIVCPKTAFSNYIDSILTGQLLTLEEMRQCINEKVDQSGKKTPPVQAKRSKRILRKYLIK